MKTKNTDLIISNIPEEMYYPGGFPHPAKNPELFERIGKNEYRYIGPDEISDKGAPLTMAEEQDLIKTWRIKQGYNGDTVYHEREYPEREYANGYYQGRYICDSETNNFLAGLINGFTEVFMDKLISGDCQDVLAIAKKRREEGNTNERE